MHLAVLQQLLSISSFRSTVISRAGTIQNCCGTAVGKTHGSPCL
jgi:hypothetical protein